MGNQYYQDSQLESDAKKIVKILKNTDTDLRGNLLLMVGQKLKNDAQGFTGNLILSAGIEYGIKPQQTNQGGEE